MVIALLALGLVLAPMLALLGASEQIRVRLAEAGSQREWSALPGKLLAVGIDPLTALSEEGVLEDYAEGRELPWVRREVLREVDLLPRSTLVFAGFGVGSATAAGLQFGPGPALAPRRASEPPLEAVLHNLPLIEPANGAIVRLEDLEFAGGYGELKVSALPGGSGHGVPQAVIEFAGVRASGSKPSLSLAASEVVTGPEGRAWSELDGTQAPGAIRMPLADGRARWFVPEQGRYRRHEPSAVVSWSHRLSGPSPELELASRGFPTGSTVQIDYPTVLAGRAAGGSSLRFPAVYTAAFGSASDVVPLGLARVFSFRGEQLAGSDALARAFRTGNLGGWLSRERLSLEILGRGRLFVDPAWWALERSRVRLPVPQLVSTPYYVASFGATYSGSVMLRAPTVSSEVQGTLEVNARRTGSSQLEYLLP